MYVFYVYIKNLTSKYNNYKYSCTIIYNYNNCIIKYNVYDTKYTVHKVVENVLFLLIKVHCPWYNLRSLNNKVN